MRAVVQRVHRAKVMVAGQTVGAIGRGLVVFVGVGESDQDRDVAYMVDKIVGLRIFPDEAGLMNRSLKDVEGALLAVSQFTLYGDCRKGKRPSFVKAMKQPMAEALFDRFVAECRTRDLVVETGRFGAMMDVELVNDGPVTLLIDSGKLF